MSKNRIDYLDVARGISIIAVIIGHTLPVYSTEYTHILNSIIFSFHMPMFFFVSGYFFKDKKGTVLKSIKSLLIPYFVLAAINLTFLIMKNPETDILSRFQSILYANSSSMRAKVFSPDILIIGMTWFLMALFFCRITYLFLDNFCEKYDIPIAAAATVVFMAGLALNDLAWMPFSIQPAMGGVLFYHIGRWCHDRNFFCDKREKSISFGMIIICVLVWWYSVLYGKVRMNANLYNTLFSVVGAVCGVILVILLSKYIVKIPLISKFLIWAGMNSMVIFFIHALDNNVTPYIKDSVSDITALKSYKGLALYLFIRLAVILLIAFLYTCVRDIVKKRSVKSKPAQNINNKLSHSAGTKRQHVNV